MRGYVRGSLIVLLIITNGESKDWCRTNEASLIGATPLRHLSARSKIHCVSFCLMSKDSQWRCQTAKYDDGECTLYAENSRVEGCTGNLTTDVWSLSLFSQDWVPLFRAYNGSGLEVYNTWITNCTSSQNEEGASSLLVQPGVWKLIKKVKISLLSEEKPVAYITFNASGSERSDWFSRNRIISSSFTEINNSSYHEEFPGSYSVAGFIEMNHFVVRRFYAHWYHNGCPEDRGWIAVLDEMKGFCDWETNGIRPSFMYCSGIDPCRYADMSFAEILLISASF